MCTLRMFSAYKQYKMSKKKDEKVNKLCFIT